jgi:hypothetical protein
VLEDDAEQKKGIAEEIIFVLSPFTDVGMGLALA